MQGQCPVNSSLPLAQSLSCAPENGVGPGSVRLSFRFMLPLGAKDCSGPRIGINTPDLAFGLRRCSLP
jgi:hypothetical protein